MVEVQQNPNLPLRSSDLELRSGRFTSATMPDENANTTDQRPLHIKNRQRDPPEFAGTPDSDVKDWLKNYDRVSQHNRWDDMIKLANVVFFLKGTALQWFDNHETEINSWDAFKAAFADVFDTPERRRQHAKDKLSKRYQAASESSTSYIEDVLRLCSRVNAAMPEDEKIRHLFKGLSQQLFSVVAPKSPPTVHQLIAECKKYEELQSGRILNASFERLPEVSAPSSAGELSTLIRRIIREELRELVASFRPSADISRPQTETSSVQQVIKDELRAALCPIAPVPCPHVPPPAFSPPICALQDASPHLCPVQHLNNVSPPPRRYEPPRGTEAYRTEDNRPVCFYCHSPGHVIRYCRRRIQSETYNRNPTSTLPFNDHNPSRTSDDRRNWSPPPFPGSRRGRSSSPYPRRRYVSPFIDATATSPPSN